MFNRFLYSRNCHRQCPRSLFGPIACSNVFFCSPLDWANEDLHQFTFIPNLAEFEAMRTKEQTLSELFTELDLDKDGLIGAAELRDFCEDIGQDITLERAAKDIALVDGNKDGKIDKDEWIELMFPKFNIQ